MKQIAIILLFLSAAALAQWTEPVEIDDELYIGAPRVVAVGETLHVIAVNPPRAWYLRSEDNGATWSEPIIPIDTSRHIETPDLKAANGRLHLVWREVTGPGSMKLFHSSSSNGGRNWSEIHQVFDNDTDFLAYPSLATCGDTLFLSCAAWEKYLFFRSFDGGQTWQDSVVIDQGLFNIVQYPKLVFSDGLLHFMYPLDVSGDSLSFEVFYRRSTDLGLNWSNMQILSPAELYPHTVASQIPSAYADSAGHILVAWMDYVNGSMCGISGDILYRVSLDNGNTWEPCGSITNTQSGWNSNCLILGNNFYVVWDDFWLHGCSFSKEAYSVSTDLGQNWESPNFISGIDIVLETNPALVYTISHCDTVLHCFFSKEIEGSQLFYIRSSPIVGVDNEQINLEKELSFNAYPNPFNVKTNFSYSMLKEDGTLEIFNLQGQLVNRIMLKNKRGIVAWDSRNFQGGEVSSGVYYATLKSGELKKTIQIMLLR